MTEEKLNFFVETFRKIIDSPPHVIPATITTDKAKLRFTPTIIIVKVREA